MLYKIVIALVVITLLSGLFIFVVGLMKMDFNNASGDSLSIAGAILFSSGIISLGMLTKK